MAILAMTGAQPAIADTCVTNGGGETEVCLSWSQATDPVDGVDFTYNFIDDFSPTVTLITGDAAWNIVVTNIQSQAPGDLVLLDIAPTSSFAQFGVSLDNGFDPAVANVGVIDLTAPALPAVRSNFNGGRIDGDIEGLSVQRSIFGIGGDLTGNILIGGSLNGDIRAYRLYDGLMSIGGSQAGDITFTYGLVDAYFSIWGDTLTNFEISIPRMSASSLQLANGGFSMPTEFDGTLILGGGLPADCFFLMAGQLGPNGVIDLQGADVASHFELSGGGAGSVINGGTVTSSGHVWVSTLEENMFTGTATFKSMEQFSAVEAEYSNIDGVINIKGDMDGQLWVRVGPLLSNGMFNIGGNLGDTGSIVVADASGFGGDVFGRIKVGGELQGSISVSHSLHGEIVAKAVNGGSVDIADDVTGSFETGKIGDGEVAIGGSVSGNVSASSLVDSSVWVGADVSGTLTIPGAINSSHVDIGESIETSGIVTLGAFGSSPSGGGSTFHIGNGEIGDHEIAGYLTLLGGVSVDALVSSRAVVTGTGIVDLNHGGVAGYADFAGGGTGQFINGGVIAGTGHLWLGGTHVITWAGTASFDAIEDWGVIETEASHIDGTIEIAGDVNGYLVARFGDLGPNANLIVGGTVQDLGTVGSLGSPGSFGHCGGHIKIHGDLLGQVLIGEDLQSTGRIDIDGVVKGRVIVNGETQAGSSIELGGIAPSGSVSVNATMGAFNANGNIVVNGLGGAFAPAVDFDGCIGIHGDGAGGFGDLNGRILVTGCHATSDDLNICIDGNVNGAVTIRQFGCPNQVGWSCVAPCP